MTMTRFEKLFVNRERKAKRNIDNVLPCLEQLDVECLNDVLEIGCGIGTVSAFLSESYQMNVVGTDFDPAQIEIARTYYPENDQLHFKVEDASNLSFEDNSFDLVLSQNVFHHIPNWENAIKEIARVLCSGGYFIWLDLTFPRIVKTIFLPFVKNYGFYTIDDIEKTLEVHAFMKLFHERLAHGPFSQHHLVLQHN